MWYQPLLAIVVVGICISAHACMEQVHHDTCRRSMWLSLTMGQSPACNLLRTGISMVDTTCLAAVGNLFFLALRPASALLKAAGLSVMHLKATNRCESALPACL